MPSRPLRLGLVDSVFVLWWYTHMVSWKTSNIINGLMEETGGDGVTRANTVCNLSAVGHLPSESELHRSAITVAPSLWLRLAQRMLKGSHRIIRSHSFKKCGSFPIRKPWQDRLRSDCDWCCDVSDHAYRRSHVIALLSPSCHLGSLQHLRKTDTHPIAASIVQYRTGTTENGLVMSIRQWDQVGYQRNKVPPRQGCLLSSALLFEHWWLHKKLELHNLAPRHPNSAAPGAPSAKV